MVYKKLSRVQEDEKCSCKGSHLDKFLQPHILSLLSKESLHGYLIIQALENINFIKNEKADSAGIYRTLRILEERQLVDSEWDLTGTGAAKKIYRITEEGIACLSHWVETLDEYLIIVKSTKEVAKEALASIKE